MCDCYHTRCSKRGCKVEIPIHITDFCLERDTFKAYCHEHLPEKRKGVTVKHTCTKKYSGKNSHSDFKKGTTFYIAYNKGLEKDNNLEGAVSINDAGDWKETRL